MGLMGVEWVATRKGVIKGKLGLSGVEHTHNAGEDACELTAVFEAVLRHAATIRQQHGALLAAAEAGMSTEPRL
jgi:hypothetical protein